MKSQGSRRFWKCYDLLPKNIQRLADKNYKLWRENQNHPSLDFKKLRGSQTRFSVRVGNHYRALAEQAEEGVIWVWIGTHEEYNKLVRR